jgi:hypothetical protein
LTVFCATWQIPELFVNLNSINQIFKYRVCTQTILSLIYPLSLSSVPVFSHSIVRFVTRSNTIVFSFSIFITDLSRRYRLHSEMQQVKMLPCKLITSNFLDKHFPRYIFVWQQKSNWEQGQRNTLPLRSIWRLQGPQFLIGLFLFSLRW